jgi:hypothetical protein
MDLTVRATWDAQASVWVAESENVPGLITEAGDLEALMSKLRVMIPELLEANGALPPNVDELPFSLIVLTVPIALRRNGRLRPCPEEAPQGGRLLVRSAGEG